MDMGQVEYYAGLCAILKADQLFNHPAIVEKSKLVFSQRHTLGNARLLVQSIIVAQSLLIDQLVNGSATRATEMNSGKADVLIGTFFAAVGTLQTGTWYL